jgi:PIN domain nuclease of toxin-antitoxin system
VNLLLDTHVVLWWLENNSRLPAKLKREISDGERLVYVSAGTLWELRIKQQIKKISLPKNFRDALNNQKFLTLDVTMDDADNVLNLPMHHRDPFDRMLISQAQNHHLKIVTANRIFKKYKVSLELA